MSTTLELGSLDGAQAWFFGDTHMGDGGRNDLFRGRDALFVEVVEEAAAGCELVVLMGDTIDLPQAFSLGRVARAHPGALRALDAACRRSEVVVVRGNHDARVDYGTLLPKARVCDRLSLGDVIVQHGHQLDGQNTEPAALGYFAKVAAHSLTERVFGFEFRVPLQDFDTVQNRAAHWLGYQFARFLRARGTEAGEEFIHHYSRSVWGDVEALFEPATELARTGEHRSVVCAHTHVPGAVDLGGGREYVNAGAWTYGGAHVAKWDGEAWSVECAASGATFTDENFAWMLDGDDPGDFFDWWQRHYRGWLRFDFEPPIAGSGGAGV